MWRLLALAIGHHLGKTPPQIAALSPDDFALLVAFYMDPKRQDQMGFKMPKLPRRWTKVDDVSLEKLAMGRSKMAPKKREI